MDQMWNWPNFSLFSSISNRFLDIPEPIRGEIIEATTDAVRKSLEEVATEIQILSLDENSTTPEKLKRLTVEVEEAERLGFDVREYNERLAELESVLDVWKEKMDRLEQVRCGMLYARAVRREAEEEKDRKALRECASVFKNIASAPWHRKDDPVKEKEGSSEVS